jgi:hypothetical protein
MQVSVPNFSDAFNPNVNLTSNRKFGWKGWLVLGVCLGLLLYTLVSGFIFQRKVNETAKRRLDILSIVDGLDVFAGQQRAQRAVNLYPLSECSKNLNSFDFEFTLRKKLTSEIVVLKTFPKDEQGSYKFEFSKNDSCKELLSLSEKTGNGYPDAYPICNYNSQTSPNCYLYASTQNGVGYRLAYYDTVKQKYVIFEKNNSDNLVERVE